MSELSDEQWEALAEVLLRHQRVPLFNLTGGQRCVGCDSLYDEPDGPNSPRHAAHIADALAPLLAEWLAEARVPAMFLADDHEECDRAERHAYQRGRTEGEARLRARVEALCGCDSTGCPCGGDRASVPTRDLRAALDADTAEATGEGA